MDNHSEQKTLENFRLVELNDLPKYSPWPARLIGLSDWKTSKRDGQFITREYSKKYSAVLKEYEKNKTADICEVVELLLHVLSPSNILFHINEQVYCSENNTYFWKFVYSKIADILTLYLAPDDTLVELGCGWGRNLFYILHTKLCRSAIGGEYVEEGQRVGRLIAEKYNLPVEFHHFDYNNPQPKFMQKLKDTVVFTHNSIEQISHMTEEMVLPLIKSKPKAVIHFEPIYEYRDKDSLLYYMWKRYTELNDYNRNLLTVLKSLEKKGQIRITLEKRHQLGINAFNPGSFIAWEPIKST